MKKIIELLNLEMTKPTNYSWFHIMFIIIVIISTYIMIKTFNKANDKTFRKIALISWIILVVLEIYKEFIRGYDIKTGDFNYPWYLFPFQFCSSPFFILPFVFLLKDCKLRDAMICFMSTFSLFAGICVMVYPNDVFTKTIGINIQTMVHHGAQVVLGFYYAYYQKAKYSFKYFLSAVIPFSCLLLLALIMNEMFHSILPKENINLFYISRYYISHLPVLHTLQKILPYPLFFASYLLGFSFCGFMIYLLCSLIYKQKIINDLKGFVN